MKTGALFGLASIVAAMAGPNAAIGAPPARQAAASSPTCQVRLDVGGEIRPRHEVRKQPRIAAIDRALAGRRADVIVLGDSITERWPQQSLEQAFPGRTVLNAGVSGDWVSDTLFRLSARTTRLPDGSALGLTHWRDQSPKLVTILIGTNDLRGATPCYIASGIVSIAAKVRALYPSARVVVLGILPRGNPQGQFADEIAAVNALVERQARQGGRYEFLDLSAAFRCPQTGACDLAIPPNYVHPSDQGYARLVAALRAKLARR